MPQNGDLFEEVTVGGEPPPLHIRYTAVPFAELRFDPANPRLKYLRGLHNGKSDEDLLFMDNDTKHLKADLKENGLFEPLYVCRTEGASLYTVVEGNRRLACISALNREMPDDTRWQTVRVRILPPNTTEKQIALVMAQFHVAGKVKWQAHEKAGHIYDMSVRHKVPDEKLMSILHIGKQSLKNMVEAYTTMMEVYVTIDNGAYKEDAEAKWSFFYELYKDSKLRGFAGDPRWTQNFCRWVGEGRIPRAEDVRDLRPILTNSHAKRMFESERAEEAFRLAKNQTELADPGKKSKLYASLQTMLAECKKATMDDANMGEHNENARQIVVDAYKALAFFMEKANIDTETTSQTTLRRRA